MQKDKTRDIAETVSMEEVNDLASNMTKMSGLSSQIENFKKSILFVIENSPENALHSNELKKIF